MPIIKKTLEVEVSLTAVEVTDALEALAPLERLGISGRAVSGVTDTEVVEIAVAFPSIFQRYTDKLRAEADRIDSLVEQHRAKGDT